MNLGCSKKCPESRSALPATSDLLSQALTCPVNGRGGNRPQTFLSAIILICNNGLPLTTIPHPPQALGVFAEIGNGLTRYPSVGLIKDLGSTAGFAVPVKSLQHGNGSRISTIGILPAFGLTIGKIRESVSRRFSKNVPILFIEISDGIVL
jgi:hypothetical protein